MQKCPFCAEEIQDSAVKCRFCNEFLVMRSETVKTPWYGTPAVLIGSFMAIGPFMLPLVWFHPRYSRRKKIILTVIILVLFAVLCGVFLHFAKTIYDYYKQVGLF